MNFSFAFTQAGLYLNIRKARFGLLEPNTRLGVLEEIVNFLKFKGG
jgi:hypothetical protein